MTGEIIADKDADFPRPIGPIALGLQSKPYLSSFRTRAPPSVQTLVLHLFVLEMCKIWPDLLRLHPLESWKARTSYRDLHVACQ